MNVDNIVNQADSILTKESVGFDIKITWLAIAKMYAPYAAKHGGTTTMAFALLNISREKGTPATKIAPLLGMEPRSLTRLIKKMEEDKLVERKPDTVDKRSVRIFLTENGKALQDVARQFVEEFNSLIRKKVPADKLEIFFDVLEDIHGVIEKYKHSNNH